MIDNNTKFSAVIWQPELFWKATLKSDHCGFAFTVEHATMWYWENTTNSRSHN